MNKITYALIAIILCSCNNDDDTSDQISLSTEVNFQRAATIQVGGEGSAEISAYDIVSKKLFVINAESNQINVYDLSNPSIPVEQPAISLSSGAPNSVAVGDGIIAVAVENDNKQLNGTVVTYDINSQALLNSYTVGALPDMVTFTPDGEKILVACEGEPNDDYTIDPEGTVGIITLSNGAIQLINFASLNNQEASLKNDGVRIYGPGATVAQDLEPEYIVVSEDGNTAYVTCQENNALMSIDVNTAAINYVKAYGVKDYNNPLNSIDASDRDGVTQLKNWPVLSYYHPDGMDIVTINGQELIVTANEGDARDYDGYSEEERIKDLILDPTAFPDAASLQMDENIGRLKTTTANGDIDGDGDYDVIYGYGARSFSFWDTNGNLVYDSGNSIAVNTLNINPTRFNDEDGRSDDKGAEPEAVAVLEIKSNTSNTNSINNRYILAVAMERTDGVLLYDVTNPNNPVFLTWLEPIGDEAPESLLMIPREESGSDKALLIISNEDSGTVNIYQNNVLD
ncbi:choice-of-anchor I family protein [Nonlabens ulvanivorans]|uniref:Alkaline phosphatase n=1 Tax=Nonlabens ulvanivorans TaxID=906888 RepID=A0A084JU64_NONUL|nr:choice-of-anchor I family protein [Nonlabens ulvanivorans]KEZ92498.1 alkaline phosphatase [Nonlabens ulvanivorans]PRX15336.1 hypothetical protein LY02_00553 [Nonlabens ulvanivorans]